MTEPDPKKIFELYNLMETKLEELNIDFDEFVILYKSFRATMAAANEGEQTPEAPKEETAVASPFPWVKYAGTGWR